MADEGAEGVPAVAEAAEEPPPPGEGEQPVEDSAAEPAVDSEVKGEDLATPEGDGGDQGSPPAEDPPAEPEPTAEQPEAAEQPVAAEEPSAEEPPLAADDAPSGEDPAAPAAGEEPAPAEEQGVDVAGEEGDTAPPAADADGVHAVGGTEGEEATGEHIEGDALVEEAGAPAEQDEGVVVEGSQAFDEGVLVEEDPFAVQAAEGGVPPDADGAHVDGHHGYDEHQGVEGQERGYPGEEGAGGEEGFVEQGGENGEGENVYGAEELGQYGAYGDGDQGYDAYEEGGNVGAGGNAAYGHDQGGGVPPRDHDAEARALAEQMVAEEREKHEQQLKVEANARAELEDMILRIEKHFKAEQAARKKAEELLQESIAAEMEAKNKVEDILNKRSQEQRLLEEERAAIKRERMALENMRQEFEGELQAARAEVGKAQEALASSEERIKATEQMERARLEADYQAKMATMQAEMEHVREELQFKMMILTQEMEKWRQQAQMTANTVQEAKDDVLERKKELDSTKEKMDKLLEKLYIGRERGIELSGAIASNQRMMSMMQGPMMGSNQNINNMLMFKAGMQQAAAGPAYAWGPPSPNSPKLPPLAKQQSTAQPQSQQVPQPPPQSQHPHMMYDNAAMGVLPGGMGGMGGFVGVPGMMGNMGNMGSFAGGIPAGGYPPHAMGMGAPHLAPGQPPQRGLFDGGAVPAVPHGVSASADYPHGFAAGAAYGHESPSPRAGSMRRVHSGGHLPALNGQQDLNPYIAASHSDGHLSPDGAPPPKAGGNTQYAHVQSKFARDAAEKALQNKANSRARSGRIGKGKPDRFAEADRDNARVAGALSRWN